MPYTKAETFKRPFWTDSESFAEGGKLKFYRAGTTTETEVYSDDSGTSLGVEVTLNARGEPDTEIFLDSAVRYKIRLFTIQDGVEVQKWEEDNIRPESRFTTGTDPTDIMTNDDANERGFAQQVDSVSALRSTSFPASLQRIWLSGYTGVGSPFGGPLFRSTGTDNGITLFEDADGVAWERPLSYGPNEIRTYSDLKAIIISAIPDGVTVSAGGRSSVGDGGEGLFIWDSSDLSQAVSSDTNEAVYLPPDSDATGASGAWVKQSGTIDANLTVSIPTIYATLQEAINALSKYRCQQGVTISLNIESGHQPESGISVSDGDYGHFYITSDDATVTLTASYSGQFVFCENGHAPTLDCLIDAQGNGSDGYRVENGRGLITPGSGVTNSGAKGLYAFRSTSVDAQGSDFRGAAEECFNADRTSYINANGSTGSGAGNHNYIATTSVMDCQGADGTAATNHGFYSQNSTMNCENSSADNCGDTGYYSNRASKMVARASTATGCAYGAWSFRDSSLEAVDIDVSNCTDRGLYAAQCGSINARNANASGAGNYGMRAIESGYINGQGVNARKGASDDPSDIDVFAGGIIAAHNATGGLSQAINTVTQNGIIFQS